MVSRGKSLFQLSHSVPLVLVRWGRWDLNKGKTMAMARPLGSDVTWLCSKRLRTLGIPSASYFAVRNVGFGCSAGSSEGFRTLDPWLKDLCVFPQGIHLWDSVAICVPRFPPDSCVSLQEVGIPSLLILGLTLLAFPECFCLQGAWSTAQAPGAPAGKGPRARAEWLVQPRIVPSASAIAPLSAGALWGWVICHLSVWRWGAGPGGDGDLLLPSSWRV